MGGKASRDKGSRVEREIVHAFQNAGLGAERVPWSGSFGGRFTGDVSVPFLGVDRRLEVKCRAHGFAQIYSWLANHYGLVIKSNRQDPLLVIRLSEAVRLAALIEKAK